MSWAHHSPVWATALNGGPESEKWHGHGHGGLTGWQSINQSTIPTGGTEGERERGQGEPGQGGPRMAKGPRNLGEMLLAGEKAKRSRRGPRKPRRGQEQGQESPKRPQDSGQERPKVEAKRGDQEKAKRGGTKNQKQPRKRAKPRRGGSAKHAPRVVTREDKNGRIFAKAQFVNDRQRLSLLRLCAMLASGQETLVQGSVFATV